MPRLTLKTMMLLVALAAAILGAGRLTDDRFGWEAETLVAVDDKTRTETTVRVAFSPWPGCLVMAITGWILGGLWLEVEIRRRKRRGPRP
jgi:hypothetical protein